MKNKAYQPLVILKQKEKTNYKGPTALISQVPARRGGEAPLRRQKGGQGVSRGIHGVSKLLQLLLGLRLIVREDIPSQTKGKSMPT